MKQYLPFLAIAGIFFLIKINGLGVRFSDSNIYFYTAYQLLEGKILYKDIFFTNFPLLPYISSLYFLLFGGNLKLYYLTPIIESIGVSFVIYLTILRTHKQSLLAVLCASVYLFSFIVLTTSDHQSGVFLASLFGVIGYYFLETEKPAKSGVFIGLSVLTKAYFLPLWIASIVTLFLKKKNSLLRFLLGFFLTIGLILLPSLLFARNEIYTDIIEYSLTRSEGIPKMNILRFFFIHDLLLIAILIFVIVRIRKNIFMGVFALSSILFIILYKDIYYLYLNFLIPFLAISFADLYRTVQKQFSLPSFVIPAILAVIFIINISLYLSSFQKSQIVQNIEEITVFLKNQSETTLYGTNDITPALAYLGDKQLLNNIVDTNENIFRKGFLDQNKLTNDAIENNSLIVTHGAYYPQFMVDEQILGGIFDQETIKKQCTMIQSYPITTEGLDNRLNIFRCASTKTARE